MDVFINGILPLSVLGCIVIADTIDSSARQELAVVGENISLECQLDSLVAPVLWKKEGQIILFHNNPLEVTSIMTANRISEVNNSQLKATLTINYVHFNDSGQYLCSQLSTSGLEKISAVINLLVHGYPLLSVKPNTSEENETVNATCCVASSTEINGITVSWLLGGEPLNQIRKTTKRKIQNGSVTYCCYALEISTSRNIHGDTLTCFISNKHIVSASVVMNVLYSAAVQLLTKSPVTIYTNEKNVYIGCETNGNPQPEVNLQKKGQREQWDFVQTKPSMSNKVHTTAWKFHLDNTSDDLAGIYRCTAFNKIRRRSYSESVEVAYGKSKTVVSRVLLIVAALIIVIAVLALARVIHKNRLVERYETYIENNRPRRSFGNRETLPDICSHSSTAPGRASSAGNSGKANTNAKTSNTLPKPPRSFGNLHLSGKVKEGIAEDTSEQIYANCSPGEGSSKLDKDADELGHIPQYATLSKTGKTY